MACNAELSMVNNALTNVAVNNAIPLGTVIHRRGKTNCRNFALDTLGATGIIVRESGYYNVGFNATFTAPVPGNVTITMLVNGAPVIGYTGTVTITTETTQNATLSLNAPDIVLNCGNAPAVITFVVSGADATFSNVAVAVRKF